MDKNRINSTITFAGIIGFFLIVSYLHFLQTSYEPSHQLMSELALGINGGLMLPAFLLLALSIVGALNISASFNAHISIKLLLGFSSLFLAGAGVFTLGNAATLHIGLVAVAFVFLVLSMYLLPRLSNQFKTPAATSICWLLGACTAGFVALGHNILPIGLAQRLATTCILLWLAWLAIFNLKARGGQGA